MTLFEQKVYFAVRKIPRGKITTYSEVARIIGNSFAYRAVGNALNKNYFRGVPCHRVVMANGRVGGYNKGVKRKINLLKKECIIIRNGMIDLEKYGWDFSNTPRTILNLSRIRRNYSGSI